MLGHIRQVMKYGQEGLDGLSIVRLVNTRGVNSAERRAYRISEILQKKQLKPKDLDTVADLLASFSSTEELVKAFASLENAYAPLSFPLSLKLVEA